MLILLCEINDDDDDDDDDVVRAAAIMQRNCWKWKLFDRRLS